MLFAVSNLSMITVSIKIKRISYLYTVENPLTGAAHTY